MKPYLKSQSIPLIGLQDKRRKLTDEQYEEIKRMRTEEQISYNMLARRFGVSKALVMLICDPEKARKNSERMKENWRRYHEMYGQEYHNAAIRKWRRRKYKMYKAGELKE